MKKQDFIDLIDKSFPVLNFKIQATHCGIVMACNNAARDLFLMLPDENQATKELRYQLLVLNRDGKFDFED